MGSINSRNERSTFSTYGRFVDFVAPGERVTTLDTDDDYSDWNGTSFSSPLAAFVAALILTANPVLAPGQGLKIMQQSAIDLGSRRRDIEYGYGLPDAQAAVDLALQTKGKFRRRYARRGIDPYVDNDWSRFSGILTGESLGLGSELSRELSSISSLALQLPQGFLASTIASTPVPEPASVLLLLVGISLLLWRPPEIRRQ